MRAPDGTPNEIYAKTGYGCTDLLHLNSLEPVDTFCGIEISNRMILWVSAITFLLFVVAEIIGALAGNSLSLLGDAAAMSVDVFTVCE